MDCRDLYLEEARIAQTQNQIEDIAGTDWRSIAGFLGDYGIGNAMAKSEAQKALREREQSIRANKVQKNCIGANPGSAPVANNAATAANELKLAYYDAKIVGVIMPGGEMKSLADRAAITVPSGVSGASYVQPVTRDGRLIGLVTNEGAVYPLHGETVEAP